MARRAALIGVVLLLAESGAAPLGGPRMAVAAAGPSGKILFTTQEPDFGQIWVAERDGSGAHRIATGANPVFSPDGKRVAFAADDGIGNQFIYSVSVDGGGKVRESGPLVDPPPPPVDANGPYDNYAHRLPHYSPDGQGIIFYGTETHYDGDGNCAAVTDGIARSSGDGSDTYLKVFWSSCEAPPDDACVAAATAVADFNLGGPWPGPDGRSIVYDENCPSAGDNPITAQVLGGGSPVGLLAGASLAGGWTADGRILLARNDPDGTHDYFVTLGGQATRWTLPNPLFGRAISGCSAALLSDPLGVVFSPDGQLAGWSQNAPANQDAPSNPCQEDHAGIWLAGVDGSDPHQVIEGQTAVLHDIQCTPGSCLSGIVITKAFGPTTTIEAFPVAFSYSGALTDSRVWQADPFNPPFADPLLARLPAGTYTITEAEAPGFTAVRAVCTGASFKQLSPGSVSVTLTGGASLATCTFTSDWDGKTRPTGMPTPGPIECTPPPSRYLGVPLIGQETDKWCWAATTEMVMAYFGKTSVRQGQMANDRFGRSDCLDTPVPSPCLSGAYPQMERYGFVLDQTPDGTALTWEQVTSQIGCLAKPIAFWWWWTAGGGHAMALSGYADQNGVRYVQIDNPWPPGTGDVQLIPYADWVQNTRGTPSTNGFGYRHGSDDYSITFLGP